MKMVRVCILQIAYSFRNGKHVAYSGKLFGYAKSMRRVYLRYAEGMSKVCERHIRKSKLIFTTLTLLFILNAGSQAANEISTKESSQINTTHAQTIMQLQAENKDLQKQITELKQEVDLYRGDVREEVSHIYSILSIWATIFCIMISLISIIYPWHMNKETGKKAEQAKEDAKEAKTQVDKASEQVEQAKTQVDKASAQAIQAKEQAEQAKNAISVIKGLKAHVDEIERRINKDKEDAEEAAKQAKASQLFTQAFSEKNYAKAIELCTKAIEINPQDAEAYNNRGHAKRHTGDFVAAIHDYDKAIEINPQYADAYCNRGNAKAHLEDYPMAIHDYDKAIEISPHDAWFYRCRGNAKYRMGGAFRAAIIDYDMAIEIDPKNEEVYCNRANAKESIKDYSGALEDYTTVIKLNPEKAMNYKNRAICYRAMAKAELDERKRNELVAKAKADEEKAKELRITN